MTVPKNHESLNFRHEYSKLVRDSRIYLEEENQSHSKKPIKEIPICEKKLWRKYRNLVWKITEKQNLRKLPNYDKRAFKGYHLDHKVSIWYGYKHKLDPNMIGGIGNLEFIPYYENMIKSTKSNFLGFRGAQTVIFV